MKTPFTNIFEMLTSSGARLPLIEQWLRNDVWSTERFTQHDSHHYLEGGEKLVKSAEEMILSAAPSVYDELVAASQSSVSLLEVLKQPKTAVVVFDGVSIREIPLLLKLAADTNFAICESRYGYAGLPSDTLAFIEQRLIGKRIGPSQIESRKELKDYNIAARHYDTLIRMFELPGDGRPLLLWSSFPDGTYMNFEARSSGHFDAIVKQFDVAWKNVVMTIPRDYRIVITSDHGYIYLNAGFESEIKADKALQVLENDRFRIFDCKEEMNADFPELQVLPQKSIAMLRGRIKNRPQGSSANKVFRHGGMSLMEMLTPYIVLEHLSMKG
jgi:hypothetical protein